MPQAGILHEVQWQRTAQRRQRRLPASAAGAWRTSPPAQDSMRQFMASDMLAWMWTSSSAQWHIHVAQRCNGVRHNSLPLGYSTGRYGRSSKPSFLLQSQGGMIMAPALHTS